MEMEGNAVRQDPFRITDNIYYVGSKFVASHLFTSESGHILIDAGMPSDGPHILSSIEKSGFDCNEIQYLVITHGHIDHFGSADYIAKRVNAKVCIGEEDVTAAEHGAFMRFDNFGKKTNEDVSDEVSKNRQKFGIAPSPVKIDRHLHEGDEIQLGPISLKVFHTPGHTAGTCSFSFRTRDNGKEYKGILSGGIGVNVFKKEYLDTNVGGANIEDYVKSIERLRSLEADLWLEGHPFFNMALVKGERLKKETEKTNPFIDPNGKATFLDKSLQDAMNELERLKLD